MYFNTFKTGTAIIDDLIDAIGGDFALLRGRMVPRGDWQAETVSEGDNHTLTVDYNGNGHSVRIKVKFTAPESRKLSPPPADVSAVLVIVDAAVVFDWFFHGNDILNNISCDTGTVIAQLSEVLAETDFDLTAAETSKQSVLDVASLFSDMQANALRILDLTVQRNGPKPLSRRLNVEESELWTTLDDGMYWYDEPVTDSVYYVILFVLPATHDVPAGNPENDRLAFFFKQYGRTLVLEEIRVNGNSIADGNGSFETWAKEHDTVVVSFYERSEELRAAVEDAGWRPEGKPVVVTIESDNLTDAAIVTALLRHAISARDSRMPVAAREDLIQKGLHGMVINASSEKLQLLREAYQTQDEVIGEQGGVDMRPLLIEINLK